MDLHELAKLYCSNVRERITGFLNTDAYPETTHSKKKILGINSAH